MLTAILFTVCLLVGVGLFIYQVWGRFNLLRAATGTFTVDRIPERLWAVVTIALGQKKFIRPEVSWVRETLAGWLHFFVFWGFTVLGLQIVTMFGRAYSEHFYVPLMSPSLLGGPYMFVRDCFEGIVLVCVLVLMARWAITRPMRLMGFAPAENRQRAHHHWEAYLILSCIGIIVSSGPVYDASRLVLHAGEPGIAGEGAWEPLSNHVVRPLLAGMDPGFTATAGGVAWWAHNLSVLVMLNFLPLAKHFHVITSLPNVFFRKLEPLGALSKQDLENATTFGTSHIDQFTWKQVLDMFSCTECGRCSSQCPATATGKPLAPRQLLLDLRDYLYAHQDEVIAKRVRQRADGDGAEPPEVGENIVGPVISDEVLWSCNVCRACEEACPVLIEYVDKVVDMRRHLVQEEARFPAELTRTFKAMETQNNPWGLSYEKRADWAEGLDIPLFAEHPDTEYLYFVGCAGAFDDRNKKTTITFAKLLKKAGVSFAILGPEEPCNGETARRLGNEYLFQSMAQTAIGIFTNYAVKKIIVNCPHCFNTLKNEFPQFGGHYEVIHAAELLSCLLREGKLTLQAQTPQRVTYHDSCYYGRYNDIYDTPREVLTQIPGTQLQEMQRHKHTGMCCGGGGGWMWMEEPHDKRVNHLRVAQALETQPDTIAVSCPFCMIMLGDGLKAKNAEETVQLLDVVEM